MVTPIDWKLLIRQRLRRWRRSPLDGDTYWLETTRSRLVSHKWLFGHHSLATPIDWKPSYFAQILWLHTISYHSLVSPIDWKRISQDFSAVILEHSHHSLVTPIVWKRVDNLPLEDILESKSPLAGDTYWLETFQQFREQCFNLTGHHSLVTPTDWKPCRTVVTLLSFPCKLSQLAGDTYWLETFCHFSVVIQFFWLVTTRWWHLLIGNPFFRLFSVLGLTSPVAGDIYWLEAM